MAKSVRAQIYSSNLIGLLTLAGPCGMLLKSLCISLREVFSVHRFFGGYINA